MDNWTALKYNFRDGLLEKWWGGRWRGQKKWKKGLGLGLRFFPRKLLIKRYIIPKDSGQKIYAQGRKKKNSSLHFQKSSCIDTYIHTCILGRMYFVERSIHLIEEHWLLIITGVQASGVIINRFWQQCCLVWSEIVGPLSLGNFNDWPLRLKAGSNVAMGMR